jgi:hypothetical protein
MLVLTVLAHVGLQTFAETTCLTLVATCHIHHTATTFFANVVDVSTDRDTSIKYLRGFISGLLPRPISYEFV